MLNKLIRVFQKEGPFSLFLQLGRAGIGAQLIALAVYPLISRLYEPDDFGVRATFAAILMLLLPFSTLNLEFAIPLAKEKKAAGDLFNTSILLSLGLGVLTLVGAGLLSFFPFFQHPVKPFLLLLPPAILLGGLRKTGLGWATRLSDRPLLVSSRYWMAGTKGGMEVAGGIWGANIWLLVASQLGGLLAVVVVVFRKIKKTINIEVRAVDWRATLREYKNYPLFTLPSTFSDLFNTHFPLLFFGGLFSMAFTGQFSMAILMIYLVHSSLGDGFAQAYLLELGKVEKGKMKRYFLRTLTFFSAVGLLTGLGIAIAGGPLLLWVLGPAWEEAAGMTAPLSLLVPAYFWSALCFHGLNKISRQRNILYFQLGRALMLIFLFFLFYRWDCPVEWFIWGYAGNAFVFGLLYVLQTYFLIRQHSDA